MGYNIVYEFGSYRLEVVERRLLQGNKSIMLPKKVFDLLLYLVQHHGHLITKKELFEKLWNGSFIEDSNLAVTVAMLRKTLGESIERQFIETVPKIGYRFIADVKVLQLSGTHSLEIPIANDIVMPPGTNNSNWKSEISSIAILPLINGTENSELDYLCDGVSESLINSLAQLSQLRVIARSSAFRYRGQDIDPRNIGKALKVSVLLSGIVFLYDNRLIIRVELIDVEHGWQLWGGQFYRHHSDLFTIQSEIALEISEKLQIKLAEEERKRFTKQHTESLEAYHTYLKGRYFWNKRTIEGFHKAIDFFNEALELDKNFTLAYVGLADCYNLLNSYGFLSPQKAVNKIRTLTKTALELNTELAEAHASLGFVLLVNDCNLQDAGLEFQRAISLNPNYTPARHWYANYLMVLERHEEALIQRKIAEKINPLSPVLKTAAGAHLIFMSQYDLAIKECYEALELDPYYHIAHHLLGVAYAMKGLYIDAIAEASQAFNLSGNIEVLASLGYVYAISGKKSDAYKILEDIKSEAKSKYVNPDYLAVIHVGLEEFEQSFIWLEKAYEKNSSNMYWLHLDPRMKILHSDSRFKDLQQKIWSKSENL